MRWIECIAFISWSKKGERGEKSDTSWNTLPVLSNQQKIIRKRLECSHFHKSQNAREKLNMNSKYLSPVKWIVLLEKCHLPPRSCLSTTSSAWSYHMGSTVHLIGVCFRISFWGKLFIGASIKRNIYSLHYLSSIMISPSVWRRRGGRQCWPRWRACLEETRSSGEKKYFLKTKLLFCRHLLKYDGQVGRGGICGN